MSIHPTALVDGRARLGDGVVVGPYAVIGQDVTVGARSRIGAQAVLHGPLSLGEDSFVDTGVVLGGDPQVRGKSGPWGGVRIGARGVFRECVTVHRAMTPDAETVIGDEVYLMSCSHVAHDCVLGDSVTICSGTVLAGHVVVGDRVFISGNCAIHQFVRIGELAMLAGGTILVQDGPPFCMLSDMRPTRVQGLNTVGMRRAGFPPSVRQALKEAYQKLFRSPLPIPRRLESTLGTDVPEVARLVEFIRTSKRGVAGMRSHDADAREIEDRE